MAKEIEVKQKKYECEHCGKTYNNLSYFLKCQICGQEVCKECGENVSLWNFIWHDWQDDFMVHKECRKSEEFWKDTYIKACYYLENEFYDKVKELNKNYLSENDEYMRKWPEEVGD